MIFADQCCLLIEVFRLFCKLAQRVNSAFNCKYYFYSIKEHIETPDISFNSYENGLIINEGNTMQTDCYYHSYNIISDNTITTPLLLR